MLIPYQPNAEIPLEKYISSIGLTPDSGKISLYDYLSAHNKSEVCLSSADRILRGLISKYRDMESGIKAEEKSSSMFDFIL